MLQSTEVVYLAKVEGHHAVRLASAVGQRFPAHATACGKALLAYDPAAADAVIARGLQALTPHTLTDERALRAELADVRAGALARDSEEIELHAACAAVPVLPHGDEPVRFALSVSGARPRIEDSLPMLDAALRSAAGALARRLYGDDDDHIRPAAA
jgi:DNA-binding IclR family transcriptional regulator